MKQNLFMLEKVKIKETCNIRVETMIVNKKIQEIEKRGKNVYRVIIGRYETEEEALSVEATLIKWVYGFDNILLIIFMADIISTLDLILRKN